MSGRLYRHAEALEERVRRQIPKRSEVARRRMGEHLDRLAAMRRGELNPEETADVEATHSAIVGRLAELRGRGVRS